MALLGRAQSAEFLGLGLYSFIEPNILHLAIDEIRLQLKSRALRNLSSLLVLAVVMGDSNKLRVESLRLGCVGIMSHNFIRSEYKYISGHYFIVIIST